MADTLVIVSKVKKHLKEAHGMRSSEDTNEALTQIVKEACAKAVGKAQADKRKTVQAKDFDVAEASAPPTDL